MKKRIPSILNIGVSSILMIFILLCLVSFSALSLMTAHSDYQLSKKTAERTTTYYKAQNQAVATLKDIDDILAKEYGALLEPDATSFYEKTSTALSVLKGINITDDEEQPAVSYSIPAGSEELLEITLQIVYPIKQGDGYYKILKWSMHNTREWKNTEGIL